MTLAEQLVNLQAQARQHKSEVGTHRRALRLTMERIKEITRRLESLGITGVDKEDCHGRPGTHS